MDAEPAQDQDQLLPTVYGELSILGYNGYIPNFERNGRKSRSKFLLCKRPEPNGIKKTRHYIVKQPQATKAIQDKDLHSISFTFSRSQTIIVEYERDEDTDMFQIGRSSESPIDFVVMDTVAPCVESGAHHNHSNHQSQSSRHHHHPSLRNENAATSSHNQQLLPDDSELAHRMNRFHRHLAKVGEELLHYTGPQASDIPPPPAHDPRGRSLQAHHRQQYQHHQQQQVLLNYPQPNNPNIPPMLVEQALRAQEYLHRHHPFHNELPGGTSHAFYPQSASQLLPSIRPNNNSSSVTSSNNNGSAITQNQMAVAGSQPQHNSGRHNNVAMCKRTHATQSTISRFACRILIDRKPPYTARIYAAGFDSSRNIFLGEKATKWEQDNSFDGLTTNGVLLMHQKSENGTGGVWREVSVDGGIYAIRESRSAAQKGLRIEDESNVLQDGSLIDLCGATLLWRSVEGFKASPTKKSLEEKIDMLNASRPQCPVGFNTLVIPRKPILPNSHHHHRSHQPYVYLKCGHVQGYHDWGALKSNQRRCPICMTDGTVAKLSVGLEPSFYVDSGTPTHVFSPCGHMASEKTVKYWSNVKIPHGTHFFRSICPFCATPLAGSNGELASTKLIFQDQID